MSHYNKGEPSQNESNLLQQVKIAGQGVVVFSSLHRQSDTGSSGARNEIKTMSQRIQPGRVKLWANKHFNHLSILKSPMNAVIQLGCEDECRMNPKT